eukprot:1157423-Pelagomonas_calceolata.AAC.2
MCCSGKGVRHCAEGCQLTKFGHDHSNHSCAGVALGEACTIVLRGASSHILEEAERSLHDALCVLQATVRAARSAQGARAQGVVCFGAAIYAQSQCGGAIVSSHTQT